MTLSGVFSFILFYFLRSFSPVTEGLFGPRGGWAVGLAGWRCQQSREIASLAWFAFQSPPPPSTKQQNKTEFSETCPGFFGFFLFHLF